MLDGSEHEIVSPATLKVPRQATLRMKPSAIRFTHNNIKKTFSCGRPIVRTLEQICAGQISIDTVPRIQVAWHNGAWFTFTGNRRLWVFQHLEAQGKCSDIEVFITNQRIPRHRLTTLNDGRSVDVRGRATL